MATLIEVAQSHGAVASAPCGAIFAAIGSGWVQS